MCVSIRISGVLLLPSLKKQRELNQVPIILNYSSEMISKTKIKEENRYGKLKTFFFIPKIKYLMDFKASI